MRLVPVADGVGKPCLACLAIDGGMDGAHTHCGVSSVGVDPRPILGVSDSV